MFRCEVFVPLAIVLFAFSSEAQVTARPVDPVFARAQELVSDGNGAAGRALIDSVLKANSPASQMYPQALFWRASLAASAADAESDYKHIVVDYPLAPQAEDALLRLAQLELARGDRDAALGHLQRIPRDYPHSKSLARASYWTARVLFEKNDIPNACAANASAQVQATPDEVELQNQIQYQGQRCASYNAARAATVPVPSVSSMSSPGANSNTASSTVTAVSSTPTTLIASPPPTKIDSIKPSARESTTVQEKRPKPPAEARDTKPSIVNRTKESDGKIRAEPPAKSTSSNSKSVYSVQVAAYSKRTEAEKLVSSLVKRGYAARVDGSVAPFRVRIGRYASEQDAEAALTRIKAKHMEGFVARMPAK